MEFRFNLEPIFTNSIIKVNSSLLPSNFRGDRRTALETTSKMAEIINTIGEYSAKAQGLSKPVTTAQKLRMSDQHLYILGDPNAGKNGVVIGLLKVGRKALYVFDENGETQTVNALCVLDFYIHESRQRSGLGKTLFEIMLNEEKFKPEKLAIDRPSDKLLGFLKKHYGLQKSIPQMNNFVIYEGFFDTSNNTHNIDESVNSRVEITASPNTALFGPQFGNDDYTRKTQHAVASNVPTIQSSPVGRYAAPRPACSMAEGNLPPQQTINPNVSNQNVSSICFTSTGPFQTTEEKNEESSSILARRHRANGLSEDPQHAVYVSSTTTKHIHAAGKPSGLSEDPQHAVYVSSTTTKYIHPAGKPSGLAIERQRLHNVSDLGRPSTIAEQTNTNQIPSQEPFNQIPQVPVQNYQVPPPPIAINQVPPNVMSGSQVSAATAQIINQVPPPPINVNSQYQVYGQTNQNIQNISMEQQQQQQPQQFQQQQNQVYVPQNQIQNVQNTDSNARDFNLRGNDSFTSMKSRRFKADGLASDPQRVIHNAKFEASKMIPAGKPSGMRYNTGKLNGSSSSPGIPNPIDSIYLMGQMNTTNSMPNILGTSLAQSIPQQQINPMSVDKNAQMIQSVQVPTPQMVTTQMQNPQMVSNQVPTPQMVTTQVQNPQIVNPQQMGGQIMNPPVQGVQMINPQVIFPQQQLMNPPQVMNTQQSVGAPTANLQMMNSQMVNAQAPTNQAIMNQQLDQNIQMPVVQVNGQRVMNGAQIIKGQMMNAGQMQSLQVPQNETAQIQNLSQIIPTPRAINNQIVDGGQMGDGQMINNQMINPRMQNPQVLNTTNPSEPVQAQTNQEMYSKQTNFIPSQMNAQNQQQQQQIQ